MEGTATSSLPPGGRGWEGALKGQQLRSPGFLGLSIRTPGVTWDKSLPLAGPQLPHLGTRGVEPGVCGL